MADQSEQELAPKAASLAKEMDDKELAADLADPSRRGAPMAAPHSDVDFKYQPSGDPESQFQYFDRSKGPTGPVEHQSIYSPEDPYGDSIDVAIQRVEDQVHPGKQVMATPIELGSVPGQTSSGWVDMEKAMQPARESNSKLVLPMQGTPDPLMQSVYDSTDKLLGKYEDLGGTSRVEANKMKSRLYNSIPDKDWQEAVRTPEGAANRMAIAHGINQQIKTGSTPEIQALGQQLGSVNEKWGQNLTVQDLAQKLADREGGKPAITQVDVALAAGLNPTMESMLAAKKALQIGRSTPFKTSVGWGLGKLSDLAGPTLDSAFRQKLLDDSNRAQSPWALIDPTQWGNK
jgi:hypothetical protein